MSSFAGIDSVTFEVSISSAGTYNAGCSKSTSDGV